MRRMSSRIYLSSSLALSCQKRVEDLSLRVPCTRKRLYHTQLFSFWEKGSWVFMNALVKAKLDSAHDVKLLSKLLPREDPNNTFSAWLRFWKQCWTNPKTIAFEISLWCVNFSFADSTDLIHHTTQFSVRNMGLCGCKVAPEVAVRYSNENVADGILMQQPNPRLLKLFPTLSGCVSFCHKMDWGLKFKLKIQYKTDLTSH